MSWQVLKYSPAEIKKAGKLIRDSNCSVEDYFSAVRILDNWRAAHAYPLHVIYVNLRRHAKNSPETIVAERLKRQDSIIRKLERFQNMSLWTMQDLGGCRVIVPTIRQLYKIASDYENSRILHLKKHEDDYIVHPKNNGYRSLHQVYQYHSDKSEAYNSNMLIEIQFRTYLQHSWATAVETLGLFTNQSIKSGQCDDETNRFFALVSSLFAIEERSPDVPNTPNNIVETIEEIRQLNQSGHYLEKLRAINVAANHIPTKSTENIGYVILKVSLPDRKLSMYYFKASDHSRALDYYQAIESSRSREKTDAVLVRTSSIRALKLAYPNYFADNTSFLDKVDKYLML